MRFALCDCGKWGDVPSTFDERIHFMRCDCGKTMFLMRGNPKEAAYSDRDKIIPGTFLHNEKI